MRSIDHISYMEKLASVALALCLAMVTLTACSTSAKNGASNNGASSANAAKSESDSLVVVKDLKVEDNDIYGNSLSCTVVNNSEDVLYAGFTVKANFPLEDNYGDVQEEYGTLEMFCMGRISGTNTTSSYLQPGENRIDFFPYYNNLFTEDEVYVYTKDKPTRKPVSFEDCSNFEVVPNDPDFFPADKYALLEPDECDLEIKTETVEEKGTATQYQVSAQLTNTTDYKWQKASVKIIAIGDDGKLATYGDDEDFETYGYSHAIFKDPLVAEYMNTGATKDTDSQKYERYLHVDHFEPLYVLVQKDKQS